MNFEKETSMNWNLMFTALVFGLAIYLFAKHMGMRHLSQSGELFSVNFFLHNEKDEHGWRKEKLYKCGVGRIKISRCTEYPGILSSHLKPWKSESHFHAQSKKPFVLFITTRAGGCFAHLDGQRTFIVAGQATVKVPVGRSKVFSYYTKVLPGARSPRQDVQWTQPDGNGCR